MSRKYLLSSFGGTILAVYYG
ncbi:hypothetical protein RHECNPAF_2530070 [Rhizobium etli CNPAF512]|nr:hypothetical protein RHECNPAF_2530070 [Rhizobium etli CNPAF512]